MIAKRNLPVKKMCLLIAMVAICGCNKGDRSFSLLGGSQQFNQSTDFVVQKKIDILWVVDNSGSMGPFQSNLTNNFDSFIKDFVAKGYDFHIAVTTSDAYKSLAPYDNLSSESLFREGTDGTSHTGIPVITQATPNIVDTFRTNALQGSMGSGDERVFSSFKSALQNAGNVQFLRPGSFLGVIILSDEDDFSDETRREGSWLNPKDIPDHDYADPNLDSVASYVSFLDQLTGSLSPASRNYNVSAVTVLDNTCLNSHIKESQSTIIGTRYIQMAQATNGVTADICSANYASALQQIQQRIIELSTQFFLGRAPVESSIVVKVDKSVVPNDQSIGWTYNPTTNSIIFHGTGVPVAGAVISVAFDPLNPTN